MSVGKRGVVRWSVEVRIVRLTTCWGRVKVSVMGAAIRKHGYVGGYGEVVKKTDIWAETLSIT